MNRKTQDEVILIIQKALKLKSGVLSIKSSANDVKNWDSLGQPNIVTELDKKLEEKTFEINKLANAYSSKKLLK